jgi:hypothetical protein
MVFTNLSFGKSIITNDDSFYIQKPINGKFICFPVYILLSNVLLLFSAIA